MANNWRNRLETGAVVAGYLTERVKLAAADAVNSPKTERAIEAARRTRRAVTEGFAHWLEGEPEPLTALERKMLYMDGSEVVKGQWWATGYIGNPPGDLTQLELVMTDSRLRLFERRAYVSRNGEWEPIDDPVPGEGNLKYGLYGTIGWSSKTTGWDDEVESATLDGKHVFRLATRLAGRDHDGRGNSWIDGSHYFVFSRPFILSEQDAEAIQAMSRRFIESCQPASEWLPYRNGEKNMWKEWWEGRFNDD